MKNIFYRRNSFLVLLLGFFIFLGNNERCAASNSKGLSTLDIINEVEKNLLYLEGTETVKTKNKINIQHGNWEGGSSKEKEEEKDIESDKEKDSDKKVDMSLKDKVKEEKKESLKDLQREAYEAAKMGHLEVSIEIYKEALEIEPNNTYSLFGLATAYHELGQYIEAKEIYMKALKIAPGNKRIMSNLLAIVTEESPMEAAYFLSGMANKNPESSYMLAQASVANSNIRNYDKAIEYLVRAISIEPNNLQYKLNLAVMVDKKGDYRGAYNLYNELLNTVKMRGINYTIPVKQIKRRLRIIRKDLL